MASPIESRVVNAAGLVQGIVLVTFPAASTIFTDPNTAGDALAMAACSFAVTSTRKMSTTSP